MDDFLQWKDWWSDKYRFKIGEGVRYASMKTALNLIHQSKGTNIIETGTTRALDDMAGGGQATILFGDYALKYGKHLWTVDILPEAIELAKGLTKEYESVITYVESDSVAFLKTFPQTIDLLYLDSMDCPEYDAPDSLNLIASQTHQANELKAAWDKLNDNSVVLLDDNNFENGGKCKQSIAFLQEKGWRCLWNDKQSLWIK
jgi:SAM-dependent methyltransferase